MISQATRGSRRRIKNQITRFICYLVLIFGAFCMLLPFIWMLSTSFKDISDVFIYPPKLFGKTFVWQNYTKLSERLSFFSMLKNTIWVTVAVVIGQLATSSMAGFAFAFLKFPGRERIFSVYLIALMIPFHVLLVPTFTLLRDLKLLNSLWALILPCLVTPFGAFLMRQCFLSLPGALAEAAKIDGCTPWGVFQRIYLPLSIPSMTTLGIFTFVGTWNDFLRPLIFLSSNKQMTLTLGIYAMQGNYATDWGILMATVTMSLLPVVILFLCVQDLFVEGIALSGMKA